MDLELQRRGGPVVTGASKGIGLAIVHALVAEGMRVVGRVVLVDSLEAIDGVTAIAADLVEPVGGERLVEEAVERHGRIDVLVNNVGGVELRLDGFLRVSRATTTSDAPSSSTSSPRFARPARPSRT